MIRKTLALWDSSMIMQCLKKKLRARCVVDCSGKRFFTKQEFLTLCTTNPYAPINERMTTVEAARYLEQLQQAREVIVMGEYVYIRPSDVVNAVYHRLQLPTLSRRTPTYMQQRATQELFAVSTKDKNGIVFRRDFWAIVSLLSGAQMTLLAYLTFVVYGWDVMEPVCYFVTTFTVLCTYAYSLVWRRACTFHAVEDHLFPSNVASEGHGSSIVRQNYLDSPTASAGRSPSGSASWDDEELAELLENFDFTASVAAGAINETK
ncbi:hypothetical protein TraAM80_06713 [Trypanosoma rangeli]|uniref:Calcium uniporter protein C-terminal domain-containing protein n=1 Tax=Trypanosoma rangeli TaxID=5698 RepID=A0A422N8V4_TRYRA|nr:uncharacterized protein TraAM80_06713 [Trypanosoma rangeli]RNF01872.1 hypothetical protein TraAM80_06713 [Trypanosoma rangeli]|eukprot:RNF01872.1 hypothetical protein TraAM80_06713 [Trypanosoma rangeli]